MTVIFVITKNKYFNVIEETAQTMCMDFINDIVWCIIDCLYQIVPDDGVQIMSCRYSVVKVL